MKKRELDVLREALELMRKVSRSPRISDENRSTVATHCDKMQMFINLLIEHKQVKVGKFAAEDKWEYVEA